MTKPSNGNVPSAHNVYKVCQQQQQEESELDWNSSSNLQLIGDKKVKPEDETGWIQTEGK